MSRYCTHILNRGVEKRKIFLEKSDYLRFVNNLFDFNDRRVVSLSYKKRRNTSINVRESKELLVDIVCWSLMPNHYHILTVEKSEHSTSLFSKKITGGYTSYFNLKNNRNGVLFQGRSKIIDVVSDSHFLHLPFYILSNPLKLFQPDWKEKGLKKHADAFGFLKDYSWTSLPDLLGKSNFSTVINKKLFFELFDTNEQKFKEEFIDWLRWRLVGGRTAD